MNEGRGLRLPRKGTKLGLKKRLWVQPAEPSPTRGSDQPSNSPPYPSLTLHITCSGMSRTSFLSADLAPSLSPSRPLAQHPAWCGLRHGSTSTPSLIPGSRTRGLLRFHTHRALSGLAPAPPSFTLICLCGQRALVIPLEPT